MELNFFYTSNNGDKTNLKGSIFQVAVICIDRDNEKQISSGIYLKGLIPIVWGRWRGVEEDCWG